MSPNGSSDVLRSRLSVPLACLALVAYLSSCTASEAETVEVEPPTVQESPDVQRTYVLASHVEEIDARRDYWRRFGYLVNVGAVVWLRQEEARIAEEQRLAAEAEAAEADNDTPETRYEGSGACGGDLPPCYVMERESGGNYNAFNDGGCGGRNCYGKWQFSGEWAGKLGLPEDLSTATPEQQDAAARQLWAGGAGCSNWAAC